MGISQLECLQLRRLVGPNGIVDVKINSVGSLDGTVVVSPIALLPAVGNNSYGFYVTQSITVPSGSGIMQVQVNVATSGGAPLYYKFQPVTDQLQSLGPSSPASIGIPTSTTSNIQNFPGWFYQGLMMYNNPTSSPAVVMLIIGCQDTTTVCNLLYFSVNCISYGPYVSQN
jgi:hypothetical protein